MVRPFVLDDIKKMAKEVEMPVTASSRVSDTKPMPGTSLKDRMN